LDRALRKRDELQYTGAADVPASETDGLIAAVRVLQSGLVESQSIRRCES
jgi:hypothetical protein